MKRLHKPTRGKWPNKLWNEYLQSREKLINAIFDEVDRLNLSNNKLAIEAKLGYQTVCNLDQLYG